MNLIWHIVQKDLRRCWIPIALLAAALLIKVEMLTASPDFALGKFVFLGTARPTGPVALNGMVALNLIYEINLHSHLQTILLWIISGADFVLLLGLMLGVLLEDPALGDRTFWRTRPIAGWQMLAAKAVFIFLIGCPLQMAMQLFINLEARALYLQDPAYYAPIHWYSAMGAVALIQAGWISVILLAAVLWRNPIMGAAVFALIWIGWGCLVEVLYYYTEYIAPDSQNMPAVLIVIGTSLLVAWLMYCQRQRRMGLLIFAAGATAVILLQL